MPEMQVAVRARREAEDGSGHWTDRIVIPGRRVSAGPGIHNHSLGLWIPGSRLSARPGMTPIGIRILELQHELLRQWRLKIGCVGIAFGDAARRSCRSS